MPYKRQNESVRKYYARNKINVSSEKPEKRKKMSFEKKIFLQGLVSFVLLIYCFGVSRIDAFVLQKQFIHKAVNLNMNKKNVQNAFDYVKAFGSKCSSLAGKGMDYFVKISTGDDEDTKSAAVTALAESENAENDTKNDETKSEQAPDEVSNVQKGFVWPVRGNITSEFGAREHPLDGAEGTHWGIDIGANTGDTVVACASGTVTDAGYDTSLGNYVKIKHTDTITTVYGHLSLISVKPNEYVDETIKIGEVGSTGKSTGPHLHLEVRHNNVSMNPRDYLVPYEE